MKNFLTKAFVCVGVLASAMALSSVAVFATVTSNDLTTLSATKPETVTNCIATTNENGSTTYSYTISDKKGATTFTGLRMDGIKDTNGKFNGNDSYVSFTTDASFDVEFKGTIQNLTFGTSSTASDNKSYTAKLTDQEKGTYYFKRTSSGPVITGLEITVYPAVATSDEYTWSTDNITIPSGLDIAKSELSYGSPKTTTNSNTLSYNGTKYTASIPTNVSGTIGTGVKRGDTTYYSYPVSLTLDASWFEANEMKSTEITVQDKNGNPLKDATVYYALDGAKASETVFLTSDENGKVTIPEYATSADAYIAYPDYWTRKVTVNSNDAVSYKLEPVTVKDTTSDNFTVANFVLPTTYSFAGEDKWSRTMVKGSYTANGYTFVGNGAYLYPNTSTTALQSAGNNNDDTAHGTQYTYTPVSNGTLTLSIRPAGDIKNNTHRGYSFNGEKTYFTESSSNFIDVVKKVTAGETYTFEVIGTGMSNVSSISFEAATQSYFEPYKIVVVGNDSYIIGKISIANVTAKKVSGNVGLAGSANETTAKGKDKPSKESNTVYRSITVNGSPIVEEDGENLFYAVKLTGKAVTSPYYVKAFADNVGSEVAAPTIESK